MVHTIGNNQPGGDKGGCSSSTKSCIAPLDNSPETAPTSNGKAIVFNFIACTSTINICERAVNITEM